jgi:hypothetical protein
MRVPVVPYQRESRQAENTRSNIILSRLPTKPLAYKNCLLWFGLGKKKERNVSCLHGRSFSAILILSYKGRILAEVLSNNFA